MTTMQADWKSQHIEGYAHAAQAKGEDGYFNAPLISHIVGNLYVGGCIDGVRLDDDFKYVVSLYKWEKYKIGPDTERVEVKMYDSAEVPDAEQLHFIAKMVADMLMEGKTLVHCQAGLNRSNLISALALMYGGMDADEAINLLRTKRSPIVLCNTQFEKFLRSPEASPSVVDEFIQSGS